VPATPTVAVALATFNGERFLREQLASLTAQTVPPSEILIGDDGSTDATLDIVDEFADRSPIAVTVTRNPTRLGFADNFFAIAGRAQADLVAWCDQDDVWLPEKLERCAAAFRKPDVVLVVHGARRIDSAGTELDRLPGALRRSYRKRSGHPFLVPYGFREVFRRRLLDEFDPAERPESFHGLRTSHDEFVYFAASCSGTVRWIRRPLALYRAHDSNTTGAARQPGVADQAMQHHGALIGAPEVAEFRASYLDAMARRQGDGDELRRAASWYRRYAASVDRRMSVYRATGRLGMLRAVASASAGGLYAPRRRGRLGPQALAKDLALAVLRGGPVAHQSRASA